MGCSRSRSRSPRASDSAKIQQYVACKKEVLDFVSKTNCAPIMVRLAWHDSGNYDKRISEWPACGGATGSIRFDPEINYGANAGLAKGLKFLEPIKAKYPSVSWADLIQMGSACAIEATGGPKIPMKYGRVEAPDSSACPEEKSRGTAGNAGLPDAMAPFGCGAKDAPTHLRNIFYRMGFDDEGIVALSGAHTLGRAFKDRSGTVPNASGEEGATKYTKSGCPVRHDAASANYMPGGKSWTEKWLSFDNSYFTALAEKQANPDLIRFPTDEALFQDETFRPYFEKFAASQEAFFEAYSRAHKKLSELGSKFEDGGFTLPEMTKMEQYVACKQEVLDFVSKTNCAPIMVRLAWHDSGNYDKRISEWPACGGATGSIRFAPEINYGANAGLAKGLKFLEPMKAKYPAVSWADLIQMGSACAIEATGGPKIPMKYGRVEAPDSSACPEEKSRGTGGNAGLPDAMAPFGCGASDAPTHLRNIFYRMGFDDEGIVALSGAHTLGRAFKDRSGTVPNASGEENATKYTKSGCPVRHDAGSANYMPGGKSWTEKWLSFDNSYFTTLAEKQANPELIRFPTDEALFQDEKFRPYFEKFAASQEAFFEAYSRAHKKLSELGSKFEDGGFTLP